MRLEESNAERLEVAIAALRRGEPHEDVAAALPPDLRPLLAAAFELTSARREPGSALRPTFVLGLEEQLRTDLRLRRTRPVPHVVRRVLPLALPGLLVLGLILTSVHNAKPGDRLYSAKRSLEQVVVLLNPSQAGRVTAHLDMGYQRLHEVEWLLEREDIDGVVLRDVIGRLTADYAAALDLSGRADDSRLTLRAQTEARMAESELARLEAEVSPELAIWLEEARDIILRRLVPSGPIVSGPTRTPSTGAVLVTDTPPPATATATMHSVTSTSPPASATVPPAVPIASLTPLPSATLVPTATSMPAKPRDPTATPTSEPPVATVLPSDPITPTRDTHLETTTPVPTIVLPPSTPPDPDPTPVPPPTVATAERGGGAGGPPAGSPTPGSGPRGSSTPEPPGQP